MTGIIETLTNMIVTVFVLHGGEEHRYHGVFLMMDESGLIIREYKRGKSKIIFFPADTLLRIEQAD